MKILQVIILRIKMFFFRMSRRNRIVAAALAGIMVGGFGFFVLGQGGNGEDTVASALRPKAVEISSVAQLSGRENSLSLSGTVSSVSEATIRAEGNGPITSVYRKLGDAVSAGSIIAEIENSGERAALLQAEGSHEAALAGLAKAKQGASITSINVDSAKRNLSEARSSAANTLESLYSTLDDAIRTKADSLFNNPTSVLPKLIFQSSDYQLVVNVENARPQLGAILERQEKSLQSLNDETDIVMLISKAEEDTRFVKKFFDDLTLALNKAISTENFTVANIEVQKASIGAARSAVVAALSALPVSRDTVNARVSALSIAETQAEASSGGAVTEDVAAAEATVKQMLGNLRAAQSRYEKTIIRSPISGTINSLSLERGDFVSNFEEVAVVSNNGALEILTYVTNEEASRIGIGSEVKIGAESKGKVARIAPALDPRTKKIEVRIAITENVGLSNGETVRLSIGEKATSNSPILIPLSALRITADGPVVFKVENDRLVKIHVVEGELRGNNVEIVEGLLFDTEIVIDARGLKEDLLVEVARE